MVVVDHGGRTGPDRTVDVQSPKRKMKLQLLGFAPRSLPNHHTRWEGSELTTTLQLLDG